MIRENIEKAVKEALGAFGATDVSFVVERPGSFEHGDYATNAALAAGKFLKKNPKEVAELLTKELQGKIEGVEKIETAGAGFINFTLAGTAVKNIVHEAHEKEWGSNDLYKNKTVMVEYTDPNPFKVFHIGHLMSNAIGESIARVLEQSGAKVIRANYQGDVGPHVAKAIWRMKNSGIKIADLQSSAKAYVEATAIVEDNPEVQPQIDEINKKIYDRSDPEINALYDSGRKASLEHFEELYKTLGTKFDCYFFESESGPIGLEVVKKHTEVFEESEGAIIFRGENQGLHTRVFINKLGLPTYEAKDLGLAELKKEKARFDSSITITASEQTEYFKVVMAALIQIHPEWKGQFTHVSHGMMRFAEGKMSSRKGNVITGESLLMDLKDAAKEKMKERKIEDTEKIAEQVAVGAIKYSVLRQASGKDIIFDQEKSLSVEGDSGPYVQYALVRARALLRNAASAKIVPPQPAGPMPVERLIIYFPEVVERAANELEPHYVTTYLTELAAAFNSWYASERMIVDGTITSRSLAVVKAIENTLAKGLQVLGIPAPEEM
ncbi:MAG: arginyl-tRNA synthetase [Parcubacteria group bacterium Gr01-1014_56]|nr:MAG: arginyl-tRNA synthetase [Parcubacteria group bacterium Gr01-1014_56]